MNTDYEVEGRVRTLEQRGTRKYLRGDYPNHENFDIEFSLAGQVLQTIDYTNAMAVFRTSRWMYDPAGRLSRALEFDHAGIELSISDFEYSEGRRECTTRDAAGLITGRSLDEFVGNLLTRVSSYDRHGQLKRSKSFEYVNDKLSESISNYYSSIGELIHQWIANYDSAERVAKTFGLKADGTPLGDGKYVYEYDDRGRRIKVWSFNDSEDIANAVMISEYVNDESGNWIERVDAHRAVIDSTPTKRVVTRQLTYFPAETAR